MKRREGKNEMKHGAKHPPLTRKVGDLFGRIRGEASDSEFLIAILLCYLMMFTAGGKSEYTISIDKSNASYASLGLWQLPITRCNTFEVLITRLGLFRNFSLEDKKLNEESAITK